MISFQVMFVILVAIPMASASGWLFYGHRRPNLSSMAKSYNMPESERVQAKDKSKG